MKAVGVGQTRSEQSFGHLRTVDLAKRETTPSIVEQTIAPCGASFSAFASAKLALPSLRKALDQAYQPQGIHVAPAVVERLIAPDRSKGLHSLGHAKTYWQISRQPASIWPHELDSHPASEGY